MADLLRVVALEAPAGAKTAVVPDPRRRLPGRGAYLHPDLDCLARAVARRVFPRALRLSGTVEVAAVERYVTAAVASQANTEPPNHTAGPRDEGRSRPR